MTSEVSKIAPPIGPFATDREARQHPAAAAIIRSLMPAFCAAPREALASSTHQNAQLITETCETWGVELGEYDRQLIRWLGGWETETCLVVAGLVERAARAGRRAGARAAVKR